MTAIKPYGLYISRLIMAMDVLSVRSGALADSTRRTILARFVTGEAPLKELAKPFNISPQAVSKHLKVLEQRRPDHARS
jgi:DNA-binding transcriptional ArsR family regulator